MAVVIWVYVQYGAMSPSVVAAIALFALGLIFGSLADGFKLGVQRL